MQPSGQQAEMGSWSRNAVWAQLGLGTYAQRTCNSQISDLLEKVLIFVTHMGRPGEKLEPGRRDASHFFARHLLSENCCECEHVHLMGRFALT